MKLRPVIAGCVVGALWAAGAGAVDPPVSRRTEAPAVDRLQLDSTAVTGNRELPRVMSIVPWKQPEPPAGPERPMGSLIEELLAPVDRDEFRREITYYRGLGPHSSATDAQATGSPAAALPEPGRPEPPGPTGASKP